MLKGTNSVEDARRGCRRLQRDDLLWWQPCRLRWEFGRLRLGKYRRHTGRYNRSVLGEKLALARIGVRGHVTVGCLAARLAQPGGSVFALLLCDGA
jgi:hypothetical protein